MPARSTVAPARPATVTAVPRPCGVVRWLPHLVFVLGVAGTLVRLVELNSRLCWYVAPPATVLVLLYVAGLARWDRLGGIARPVWFATLLTLWSWVAWVIPVRLAAGYVWLAVPLAVLALRMTGRRLRSAAVVVVTLLLAAALVRIGGVDLEVLAPPVAAVAATVVLYGHQQRLTRELADARGELVRQQREVGRLAERSRIARDLHDTLAQELSGSRMLLQAADRDWDRRPETARRQVRAVVEALGAHLAETRSIIGDLTPPALERDGLETVLRDLCARTEAAEGAPHISFHREREPYLLPTDRALVLLRVTQGLLANACEHARAGHVQVTLAYGEDARVTVTVRDDGRGFTPAAGGATDTGRGYGLAAARERLDALGGALTIDSTPGHGTCAEGMLPALPASSAGERIAAGAR